MSSPARVSIRQVAEHAGVSRMTVSNVMRGRNGIVAPETMERVLKAVRELGYAPVAQPARQSRHMETRAISMVFDQLSIKGQWGAPTNLGMIEAAQELDYDLITLLRARPDWMQDQEQLQFLDRRSDGFIFVVPKARQLVLETLVAHDIPVASCFTTDVPSGVATVELDNSGAMRQAVDYLLARGHRRILHVAGTRERSDFRGRRNGYEGAMQQAGLRAQVQTWTGPEDESWLNELKLQLQREAVTAMVCVNDSAALKAWRLAQSLGLSVPRDISIIGMDDTAEAAQAGLTTFRFSCEDVGRSAVHAIGSMIGGATAESCSRVLPVELVERSSVAAVAD